MTSTDYTLCETASDSARHQRLTGVPVELDTRADTQAAAAAASALLRYQTHGPGGLLSKAGTFTTLASVKNIPYNFNSRACFYHTFTYHDTAEAQRVANSALAWRSSVVQSFKLD